MPPADALDYSRYFWQGERVRLRPLTPDDAETTFRASLDSPGRGFLQLGVELPSSVALQRAALEPYVGCKDADGVIVFGIEALDGGDDDGLVGGISLNSRDEKNGVFSFGIVVYQPHRGRGYARDAARILLRYGFCERRNQKCNSACAHTNAASIRLHEALGFQREGLRRRVLFMNGRYYDDVLWGLTREEFDAGVGV